jgi:hypothetical protein
MSFDRDRLPDPLDYYASEGLTLQGRGKWRSACCPLHGGDSLRVNVQTGAFACMGGCDLHGGDVLAWRMSTTGEDFVSAAKALGAWIDDGKPAPSRPTPIPARDALQLLASESSLIAVAAANVAHGVALTANDLNRVLTAASRVAYIAEEFS